MQNFKYLKYLLVSEVVFMGIALGNLYCFLRLDETVAWQQEQINRYDVRLRLQREDIEKNRLQMEFLNNLVCHSKNCG